MDPNISQKNVKTFSLNDDWKIIKFLNWTGVALGVAPPYNFKSQKFESLPVYRYYGSLIIVLTVFGFVYSFVGRHFYVYPYMNLTTITMDFLSLLLWTIFNITVAANSAFCTKLTEQLLGSLVKNDMFLHPKQIQNAEKNRKLKFQIWIGLLHFGFVAILIYDSYVWCDVFEPRSLNFYFFKNFQYYIPIFVTLRFCEILKLIKSRFNYSTKVLLDLVNEIHKFPLDDDEHMEEELKNLKWIRVSQRIKPRQEDIMQLKLLSKIFNTLFESVEIFNSIFESLTLFLIFATVVEIFQTINFLIAYASGSLTDPRLANNAFAGLRIAWTILFVVLAISIIKHSVDLKEETRGLAIQINKRILQMPSEELLRDEAQEELITLNLQFMHRPLAISGTFFVLDYGFVTDIFLTITSFCPVIIQFNRI